MVKERSLKDVFWLIANRIDERKDSLSEIKNLQKKKLTGNIGLEGWLKVETAKALEGKIKRLQNRGPDLLIDDKEKTIEIELKAMSNFSVSENSLNQADIYLFLADRDNERWKKVESFKGWRLIDKHIFNDGIGDWILFMIKRIN